MAPACYKKYNGRPFNLTPSRNPPIPSEGPPPANWRTRHDNSIAAEADALVQSQPSFAGVERSQNIDPLHPATHEVMSRSTDPEHFFQSHSSDLERLRRKNKSKNEHGNPMRLGSKILAVIADPLDIGAVYIAQSDGRAARIELHTKTTSHIYSGPTDPITSLALTPNRPDRTILFAGCWDKSVWSWNTTTSVRSRRYVGHTDFVKSLLCLNIKGFEYIISGSADAYIIIWNVSTGERVVTLKGGHTRGILCLAVDPETLYGAAYPSIETDDVETSSYSDVKDNGITIFSAGSDRTIRRWRVICTITEDKHVLEAYEIDTDYPIIAHETSVFHLCFDYKNEDQLWTASADGTVKSLNRSLDWAPDARLDHGDYVDTVVLNANFIVSAGRNEEIKLWRRETDKYYCSFLGHFEEITGLVLINPQNLVSVSIDGTVRQWSMRTEAVDLAKERAERGEFDNDIEEEDKERIYDSDLAEDDADLEAFNKALEKERKDAEEEEEEEETETK